jgi:hypothetical protein
MTVASGAHQVAGSQAGISWAAWASFIAAGATLVLAFLTWRAVRAAYAAVAAERDGVVATNRLADEARLDRELAWRPYLTMETRAEHVQGDSWSYRIGVKNVGSGPALQTSVFQLRGERWGKSGPFSFAPSDAGAFNVLPEPPSTPVPAGVFDEPGENRSANVRVAVCKDMLGNMWRFVDGHEPDMVPRGAPTQALTWARLYL